MFILYLNVFLSRYCMHVELGLEESRIRYEAGDHVAIYPTNDLQLVNKIGQLLEIDLDTVFTMKALDEDATKKSPFPVPTTYRTALKHYVRTHHMFLRVLNFLFVTFFSRKNCLFEKKTVILAFYLVLILK